MKVDQNAKYKEYNADGNCIKSNKQLIIVKCPPLSCKLCEFTFTDEKELSEHTSWHLNEEIVDNLVDDNDSIVQDEYVLFENTKGTVSEDKNVLKSCGICDFKTYGIMDLQKHIFQTHAEPLPCDQCDVVCQTTKQLVKHKQHDHQVKALICKFCSCYCNDKKEYDQHVSSHNDKYKCSKCDFKTKYKRVVQEHSFLHMNLKPYGCACCEFKSFRASNLVRHQYTHSSTKPLKCPECSYSTIQKTCLTRHMMKHLQS
ncbi:hypothetical protein WDU94_006459 [Cyamophila willieti]